MPLDADAAAASGGELFGKVNFLWHAPSMCLSPNSPHVEHAEAIDLFPDKGRQPIHIAISW